MSEQKNNLSEQKYQTLSIPAKFLYHLCRYRIDWANGITAIFMIWFSMLLMYGMVCIAINEFYRFIFLLRNPFIISFNLLALIAAVLHSLVWFNLTPQMLKTIISERKIAIFICISVLWIITLVISFGIFHWAQG